MENGITQEYRLHVSRAAGQSLEDYEKCLIDEMVNIMDKAVASFKERNLPAGANEKHYHVYSLIISTGKYLFILGPANMPENTTVGELEDMGCPMEYALLCQ